MEQYLISFDEVEFKLGLIRTGIRTLAELARRCGVSTSTMVGVSRGTRTNSELRAAIAAALNVPEERLWPKIPTGNRAA
jgi:lambda repressor-like predicted transcriptional regulator